MKDASKLDMTPMTRCWNWLSGSRGSTARAVEFAMHYNVPPGEIEFKRYQAR